jgi:YD repeat-containing protein
MTMLTFNLRLGLLAVMLFHGAWLSAQTYFHDPVGRLVQVSYPDGKGIRYNYDAGDNLTAVQPLNLPPAPGNLLVNRLSDTTVELTWTDNSGNEIGFAVFRRVIGNNNWTEIALVASNAEQYIDDTASPALDYAYRVSARGTEGLSAYSNAESTVVTALMISGLSMHDSAQGPRLEIRFPTVPGAVYRLEATVDLAPSAWQPAAFSTSLEGTATSQTIQGSGVSESAFLDASASRLFIRLLRE